MTSKIINPSKKEGFFNSHEIFKKFDFDIWKANKKVRKFFDKIKEQGHIERFIKKNEKGGWDIEYYLMDAPALFFLMTLMGNTSKVLEFKKFATDQFKIHHNYPVDREWKEIRESGKNERRLETDAIKEFIEMAKSQGSTHADMYYVIFTKMTYECLFTGLLEIECPNYRDIVNSFSLSQMQQADRIVAREVLIGIAKRSYYKTVFKRAKEKVLEYAALVGRIPTDIAIDKTLSSYEAQKKQILLSIN
jgi:hypothetical protein